MLASGLAVLCGLAGVATAQEPPPVFRFAPPDGTTYTEAVVVVQLVDFGEGRTSSRQSVLKTKVDIRKLAVGYNIVSTLLYGQTTGGAGEPGAALEALQGVPLTYEIDGQAHLISVTGAAQVRQKLEEALPSELAAAMAATLSDEGVLAAARSDWNRRVLSYVGVPAQVGEAWVDVEEFTLPSGGTVDYYSAHRVAGVEDVAGVRCLRVEFTNSRDPAALRPFLGPNAEALLTGKPPLPGSDTLSGSGNRVVDPTTLLCYGEEVDQKVTTTVAVPGNPSVPVTIDQRKTYDYDYAPPEGAGPS